MSLMLETTLGDIMIDLFTDEKPRGNFTVCCFEVFINNSFKVFYAHVGLL